MRRRTTAHTRPLALALGLAVLLTSCSGGSRRDESAQAARERREAAREQQEQQTSGTTDPFAGLNLPEKTTAGVRVHVPSSKSGQLKLVDNQVWRDAVEKAHQAEIIFAAAGRSWDAGTLTREEREEIQRGKALLQEAADATWAIEDELVNDPTRNSLYQAVSQVRTKWIDRMREVGKLVRG